ncbi:MAG: DUF3833 domain-containing protein [Rhodoferax sp.]|nr:DUF3833 domain-containing protein [Rhodoferax sp.]MCF8209595.1 DUF3833 domain-containing protein [Rhodoferax sp.]
MTTPTLSVHVTAPYVVALPTGVSVTALESTPGSTSPTAAAQAARLALLLGLGFVLLFFPPESVRGALAAWAMACLMVTYTAYNAQGMMRQSWGSMLGGTELQRSHSKNIEVQFDDWMYLMNDRVMPNKAVMRKFWVRLGKVTLTFVNR